MTSRKRLLLFVEGHGDEPAAYGLVKRLMAENNLWGDRLSLDPYPFRVGGVARLVREDAKEWVRLLQAAVAMKKGNLGGVLLLLDGDPKQILRRSFCPFEVGHLLSERAKSVGAGKLFSVATVFAMKEFEAWLIAGVRSLAGVRLPDGRVCVRDGTEWPSQDLEEALRDAKGWLSAHSETGYKATRDQAILARLVSIHMIRERQLRGFTRLENALRQLATSIESGNHIVSPRKLI
jgi:hypothetical protein